MIDTVKLFTIVNRNIYDIMSAKMILKQAIDKSKDNTIIYEFSSGQVPSYNTSIVVSFADPGKYFLPPSYDDKMVLSLESKVTVADNRIREKAEEIVRLNKEIEAIKERVKLSAYELNQCKMKAGRPIARKGAYSEVQELELRGYTDKQIMQEFDISRSTLWRYRKQAGAIR